MGGFAVHASKPSVCELTFFYDSTRWRFLHFKVLLDFPLRLERGVTCLNGDVIVLKLQHRWIFWQRREVGTVMSQQRTALRLLSEEHVTLNDGRLSVGIFMVLENFRGLFHETVPLRVEV